jgi:hypothetical protein
MSTYCTILVPKATPSGKPFVLCAVCATLPSAKKAFAYLSLNDRANAVGKTTADQVIVDTMQGLNRVHRESLKAWEDYDSPDSDVSYWIQYVDISTLIEREGVPNG